MHISKHIPGMTIVSLLLIGTLLNLPVYAAGNDIVNQQTQQTIQQNNNQVTAAKANPLPGSVELSPVQAPALSAKPAQSATSRSTRINPPALGNPNKK